MLKGLGGLGDMAKMMKAAQEMQTKVTQLQEDMHNILVTGESGAGLVKATATAKGELKALDIDPSIFNGDDKEVVEDLILAIDQRRVHSEPVHDTGELAGDIAAPGDQHPLWQRRQVKNFVRGDRVLGSRKLRHKGPAAHRHQNMLRRDRLAVIGERDLVRADNRRPAVMGLDPSAMQIAPINALKPRNLALGRGVRQG